MILLTQEVLPTCMLRRTKKERAADVSLPPCEVTCVSIELTAPERDFYESLYKRSAAKFDVFVAKNTLLHNYAHIFQLLARLRQALDHPYLVLFSAIGAAAIPALPAAAPPSPSSKPRKIQERWGPRCRVPPDSEFLFPSNLAEWLQPQYGLCLIVWFCTKLWDFGDARWGSSVCKKHNLRQHPILKVSYSNLSDKILVFLQLFIG